MTYVDVKDAQRAVRNKAPNIDGRRANCNLAALGTVRRMVSFFILFYFFLFLCRANCNLVALGTVRRMVSFFIIIFFILFLCRANCNLAALGTVRRMVSFFLFLFSLFFFFFMPRQLQPCRPRHRPPAGLDLSLNPQP